jgi:TP901 family phage tail tape measure protein
MANLSTNIIISAKDAATSVFRKTGMELEALKQRVFSLNGALAAVGMGVGIESIITQTAQFETALNDMGKVTDRNLSAIRDDVMNLDASLGDSTAMMQAYYQTISGGVTDAAEALDLIKIASKASNAAHVQQDIVIKALTGTLKGFNGEIKSATEASDLLFAIEKEGRTTFGELVPVIGDLAQLSHELGVKTTEMGGALSLLTQTAGTTSQAATQYRAVLVALYKPSEDLRKLLTRMGYESGQALVSEQGLAGAMKTLDREAKVAGVSIDKLFGDQEALLGRAALKANAYQDLADKTRAIGAGAGATEAAFSRWEETLQGVYSTAKNTVGRFAVEFGTEIAPTLKEGLQDVTGWLTDNRDEFKGWAEDAGDAVGRIAKAGGGLVELYQSIPEELKGSVGIGILGAMLFGGKGGALIFAAAQAMEMAKRTTAGMAAAAEGDISWTDYIAANDVEMNKMLADVQKRKEALQQVTGELAVPPDPVDLNPTPAPVKPSSTTVVATGSGRTSGTNAALVRKAYAEKLAEKYKLQPWQQTQLEGMTDSWLARDKGMEEANERAEQLLEEQYQTREMWARRADDISGRSHKYRVELLEEEIEELRRAGADEQALRIYYAQERARIDEDDYQARMQAAETFGEYFKNRFMAETAYLRDENLRRLNLWGEYYDGIGDIAESFADGFKRGASEEIFNWWKNGTLDMTRVWESAWDSMLRTLAQKTGDMLITAASNKLWDIGSGLLGGFDFSTVLDGIFHSGALDISHDEFRALLQKGEMVVPADKAEMIREAMDGRGGSDFFGSLASTVEAGAHVGNLAKLGMTQDDMRDMMISSVYSGALGAMLRGAQTMAMGGQYVSSGLLSNSDLWGAAIDDALSGAFLGTATTFATSLMGRMLGITNSEANLGPVSISASSVGTVTAGLLGQVLGLGTPFGALAGPVIGLGIAGLMDAFDMRENEQLIDAFEDRYGWFAGNRAYASMNVRSYETSGLFSFRDPITGLDVLAYSKEDLQQKMMAAKASKDARDSLGEYGGKFGGGWNDSSGHHDGSSGHNVGGEKGSATGTGGGYNDGKGGVSGLADGGLIDRVIKMNPRDDGFAYVQMGEGIVNRGGMATLARINRGESIDGLSNAELLALLRDLVGEVRQLRTITTRLQGQAVDTLDRWERNGMPQERAI